MYSNPLTRKYAKGGATSDREKVDMMLTELSEWLSVIDQLDNESNPFKGRNPKEIHNALIKMLDSGDQKIINQIGNWYNQCQASLSQQSQSSQPKGMFKQGGKLHDFICKHATGGRVKAGCGCHENGGEIKSAEKGTKTKNNYALDGLNFVERYYDPSGNAVYTLAQSRETLPSNMRSNPYSEYSQNGGEYQGDGQVSIVDFGNGRTAINMDPYGVTPGDTFAHGADSIAVLNRLRQIAPKAGIILGPAIRKCGGKVKKAQNGKELTLPENKCGGRIKKGKK